jgi:hypothetical protein
MNSTESRYNFYSKAFKGGAQPVAGQQVQTIDLAPQQQDLNQNQTQEQQDLNQSQTQPNPSNDGLAVEEEGLKQINEQVPKTKVDFKIASMIGNLDQTLGSKQKINIDKLFMSQLFGSTY